MILTQAQATAIYNAMCALNNVASADGIYIRLPLVVEREYEFVEIRETDKDVLRVSVCHSNRVEHHAGQAAFATAYGIA